MKFQTKCSIGKVKTFTSKTTGTQGANILLFNLSESGLDSLDVMTRNMELINSCGSKINQECIVTIDVISIKNGTMIDLIDVNFNVNKGLND